jgi:nucleotide-binding universal stress UspA family protein
MPPTGSVVVGTDGSDASRPAVEFALREAARRDALLRVVIVAALPDYWAGVYGMPALPRPDEVAEDARTAARAQLDEIRRDHPELAAVAVDVEARTGAPGHALVDAAAGADVLVVGHRGRGALGSALLGSVGLQCVLHATCPVTIVRPAAVAEPVLTTEAAVAVAPA